MPVTHKCILLIDRAEISAPLFHCIKGFSCWAVIHAFPMLGYCKSTGTRLSVTSTTVVYVKKREATGSNGRRCISFQNWKQIAEMFITYANFRGHSSWRTDFLIMTIHSVRTAPDRGRARRPEDKLYRKLLVYKLLSEDISQLSWQLSQHKKSQ